MIEGPDRMIWLGGAVLVGALVGVLVVIHAVTGAPGATLVRITHPVVVAPLQVSISWHDVDRNGGRDGR